MNVSKKQKKTNLRWLVENYFNKKSPLQLKVQLSLHVTFVNRDIEQIILKNIPAMRAPKPLIAIVIIFSTSINYSQRPKVEEKIDSFLNELSEEDFSGSILVAKNDICL